MEKKRGKREQVGEGGKAGKESERKKKKVRRGKTSTERQTH
jgi:hypothetical protein